MSDAPNKNIDDIIAASVNEYRRHLLTPDYDGFESYYGCRAALELRQFYALFETMFGHVLYGTTRTDQGIIRFDFIQYAEPMHSDNWSRRYGREFFQFAVNTDGYPLLIKPSLVRSLVFMDSQDYRPVPHIKDLGFTLEEIVGTLSPDASEPTST